MKKVLIILQIVLMMITLGGCMLNEQDENKAKGSSDLPSADWSGAKEAVETNLTAIFKKALEEKYGETFIVKSVSTPALMQGYYSAKFAPEWKPDVKLDAKFSNFDKNGNPTNFQDGYIAVKFSDQADAVVKPIFDQYFSEYEISVNYGKSYYPAYLDGNSTFEEFQNEISDFGPSIGISVTQKNITIDYVNEKFDTILKQIQERYPSAGSFVLVLVDIDDDNNRTVLDRKSILWGRD